jgi:hypothetical protein
LRALGHARARDRAMVVEGRGETVRKRQRRVWEAGGSTSGQEGRRRWRERGV